MRILQLGFGTVGKENIRQLLNRGHDVAAIVSRSFDTRDMARNIDLSRFDFNGRPPIIETDLAQAISKCGANLILQATAFDPDDLMNVARKAADAKCDVISVNPVVDLRSLFPDLFHSVDRMAKEAGIRVVGVGVIPGFFSDILPLILTGACADVSSVRFRRRADFSRWSRATMKAFGFGLIPADFHQQAGSGDITLFRGLWQSANLIAHELGWPIEHREETKLPLASGRRRSGPQMGIDAGTVGGFSHRIVIRSTKNRIIDLEVTGYLDPQGAEESPAMLVEIDGAPQIRLDLSGGVLRSEGSVAGSSARMINSITPLATMAPGFRTTADMALVACR